MIISIILLEDVFFLYLVAPLAGRVHGRRLLLNVGGQDGLVLLQLHGLVVEGLHGALGLSQAGLQLHLGGLELLGLGEAVALVLLAPELQKKNKVHISIYSVKVKEKVRNKERQREREREGLKTIEEKTGERAGEKKRERNIRKARAKSEITGKIKL